MINRKIFYIMGGILIILIIFLLVQNNSKNNIECNEDLDCSFFYTTYGKNSCVSCFYADKEWICMNKYQAKKEISRIIEEYFEGSPPSCEMCLETDYQYYSCKCINNKCVKQKK